ncbi:MAG: SAM-dependent methyltransferase [Micromonosporaceae bacterium]
MPWREAMQQALYGPGGFFVAGAGPAAHFRTSANSSGLFGTALARLLTRLDRALGQPPRLDVVDVGAGRGELLRHLADALGRPERCRFVGVERASRPAELPPWIEWYAEPPEHVTGLLLATEWLDNVPLEVAERGDDGAWRTVLVDPATGVEELAGAPGASELDWLTRWWPEGRRAEIGLTRDQAWAAAVGCLRRGVALAVDYGHLAGARPPEGTLTGYRDGRQVPPRLDGSTDVTAHVAIDAVRAAGERVAGLPATLTDQRSALRALGVDGTRPPLSLASSDPRGYVRQLAAATLAAELTDPYGLGGHHWLLQPAGLSVELVGI